jgi:hypothetical protein
MNFSNFIPIKIRVLLLCCLPMTLNASGPEEEYWFNYGKPLPYHPERIGHKTDIQIYNALIQSFTLKESSEELFITDAKQLVESLNKVNNAAGRTFDFIAKPLEGNNQDHSIDKYKIETTSSSLGFNYEIDGYGNYGWGRCGSSSFDNVALLYRLISDNDKLSDQELLTWLALRLEIDQSCKTQEELQLVNISTNLSSKPSFIYLQAIKLFYLEDFSNAALLFEQVADQSNGKIKPIGLYMQARSYLALARANWWSKHTYGDEIIDNDDFKFALLAFEKFTQAYPIHDFSKSAKGQIRHIYWVLSKEKEYRLMLEAAIVELFAEINITNQFTHNDSDKILKLMTEYSTYIDNQHSALAPVFKVFENQLNSSNKSIVLGFISRLHRFKTAQQYFREKKHTKMSKIFTKTGKLTSLEKILIALNMEALGNETKALGVWASIDRPDYHMAVQTRMVEIILTNKGLASLLNSDIALDDDIVDLSLVRECSMDKLSEVLIGAKGFPKKLKVINEITRRLLSTNKIDTLWTFLSQFSEKLPPHLKTFKHAAKLIVVDKNLGQGYLIIARNMQYNLRRVGHDYYIDYNNPYAEGDKECSHSKRASEVKDPYYYYQKALASFGEENSDIEAKTLHSLVTCFRSLDFDNSCRWNWEDDENPSKAWFKKLHKKYKGSYWANKTPYHY